jgi:hypothetical protein
LFVSSAHYSKSCNFIWNLSFSLNFVGLQIPGFWAGASDVDKENIWKWVAEDEQVIT